MKARLSLLLPLAALSACGGKEIPRDSAREVDPAILAALADPIMIDPDLASQNRGNAAIALDTFDGVPLDDISPASIQAAKADAARLAGGLIRTAPDPSPSKGDLAPALTAGQLVAALPALPSGCVDRLRYDYAWAAEMPGILPIYPRGHVREAAGNDGCGLRSVLFVTPVEPGAVIDFYQTLSADAGYTTERQHQGDTDVLKGTKRGTAFIVRVRQDGALTRVELATGSS